MVSGGVGLLVAGAASDRLRSTSRIPQIRILLMGQALLLIFLWRALDNPLWVMAGALGVTFLAQTGLMLGVSVWGMDLGRRRAVATVAGLLMFASSHSGHGGLWPSPQAADPLNGLCVERRKRY